MENLIENEIKTLSDKEMCLLKVGIRYNFRKIDIYGTIVEDYTHSKSLFDDIIKRIADVLFEKEEGDGNFPVYNEYIEEYQLIPKMINFGFTDINIRNLLLYYLELEFRKRFNK
jgi:hypothetical protein